MAKQGCELVFSQEVNLIVDYKKDYVLKDKFLVKDILNFNLKKTATVR